jgi:hypothetical protein
MINQHGRRRACYFVGDTSAASTLVRMPLTRIERNKIFEAIAQSSLDPTECTLDQNDNEVLITHTNSGSTFRLTFDGTGHVDFFGVQSDVIDGHHLRFRAAYEIDSVTAWITTWANEVREIFDAPDLWVEMRRSRELIAQIQRSDSDNTPFTQDEQKQIAVQLQEITKQLKEQYELTDEQTEQIDEWRDEATEASTRLGRKDWRLLFYGTVLNLKLIQKRV